MKKFGFREIGGLIAIVVAACMAAGTELDNQKKERQIEDLEERVSKLESNEEGL